MESIQQFWVDVMAIPAARWMVAIFGLACGILIAFYVVKRFRDLALGGGMESINQMNHLSEFERLYAEGKLNEDEYRRLKKALPQNILPGMTAMLNQKSVTETKTESKTVDRTTKDNLTSVDRLNDRLVQETPDFTESKDSD